MGRAAYEYPQHTLEDYFSIEQVSGVRHEYFRGDIYAMAGGSRVHGRIIGQATTAFNNALRPSGCYAAPVDQQVWVKSADLLAYPDVAVLCQDAKFDDTRTEVLLEPKVLVEVLSPTTSKYDQTTKLSAYQQIATLTDYLIIWQDQVRIDHYFRTNDSTWSLNRIIKRSESILIHSLDISILVDDIYLGLDLPESPLELVP